MTDHDYWLEDMQAMKKRQKPNYPRRRIKFALAVVALIVTSTLMLTWHGGSTTAALMVEGVYISHRIVADRQIRATRLKTSRWLTVQTNNQKSGCSAGYPRSLIRRPVGTITENRYYPRAYELNTAQQIT